MGFCNSPDISLEKISKLFYGLDMVRAYMYDVLVVTKNNLEDHLNDAYRVLQRRVELGLKVNAEKSFLGWTEM